MHKILYYNHNPERQTEIAHNAYLKEICNLAFSDIRRLFNPDNTPKNIEKLDINTASALQSIEVINKTLSGDAVQVIKYKFFDKLKYLEELAKYFKLHYVIPPGSNDIKITIVAPDGTIINETTTNINQD